METNYARQHEFMNSCSPLITLAPLVKSARDAKAQERGR
jgi:hypothetical protein